MSKSSWKIPYVDSDLLSQIINNEKILKTNSRSSVILPNFVGKTIHIHTGKIYRKILITIDMVGHKLGEFAFTRKIGRIHAPSKRKVKKRRK